MTANVIVSMQALVYRSQASPPANTYTIEEKGLSIRKVIDMETHNSITKGQMLKAMNWMWEQIFELKQEGE